MNKILILGPCGAGKSTLARRCGEILQREVVHLDALYWKPGWVEEERQTFVRKQREVVRRSQWIIDGNYTATIEERLPFADTVVLLDLPPRVYRRRVLKRIITYFGRQRPDMGSGCREHISLEFLKYVWRFDSETRPRLLDALGGTNHSATVIRLNSQAAVSTFLRDLASGTYTPISTVISQSSV